MPRPKDIAVFIGEEKVDMTNANDLPISISYSLEDTQDFQSKKSSEALSIVIPATTKNDKISNTFHNPEVEDLTPGEEYRSFRKGMIEANSHELLVGQALLTHARHTNRPTNYEYDFYGNNGDWIIPLKEATLYDFFKHITFILTKELVQNSWAFDGTNENLPYVFAPVRYGQPMDSYPENFVEVNPPILPDFNMTPIYMRPAMSVYWLIYWGFKSIGYRISSSFMNTPYFRRQVMPWTWGNFLYSDGTKLDNLDFLAKSTERGLVWNTDFDGYLDCHVTNDSTDGGFDNNGTYNYDSGAKEMKWTYLPAFNYGTLEGTFHVSVFVDATATANSNVEFRCHWFKNGVLQADNIKVYLNAPTVGRRDFIGIVDDYYTANVNPGDVISLKFWVHTFDSGLGRANISVDVEAFELDYFKIPIGGTIAFDGYTALKKYKFLDFLAGILDAYNISPQTDPISKVVTLEPIHPYSLTNNLAATSGGYMNGNFIDWDGKQDIGETKESELQLFSDSEREMIFQFKNDGNDGLLKKVQDRDSTIVAQGKYAFPDRFKAGKKEVENRFFSPVIHCELNQWKGFGSDPEAAPQIVCMVPENISNTSKDAAQNTFEPKLCYYKGLVSNVGWKFDGLSTPEYPYMFAVNYQPGGENDPVLSYCDERIGKEGSYVLAKGLLRRFFLQRMAIIRNGQFYNTYFRLNNFDVTNWLHREHIVCRGNKWELVQIEEYMPLREQSTKCTLRKHAPITQRDSENVFPSQSNVLATNPPTGTYDMKYYPLKCLSSDLSITQ